MAETKETKIFDEYEVDCNQCAAYWNNQCDGVSCANEGTKSRKCTAYEPVRRIDIPTRVDQNTKDIKSLNRVQNFILLMLALHLLTHLIFG
jgi:hypothetical protein